MSENEEVLTIITVGTKKMSSEEFEKLKEEISKDKSKRLKETSPGNFVILSRMQE